MSDIKHHVDNSGINLNKLAQKANIELGRLLSIMSNEVDPTLKEVRDLAKALKIPIKFLLSNQTTTDEVSVLFRSSVKTDSEKYNAGKFSYYVGNAFQLLNKDSYEKPELINLLPKVGNTKSGARQLAIAFRQVFLKGDEFVPLTNLPEILTDKLRIVLYTVDLGIEGASAIVSGIPFIFISPRFISRMLFTLAHELGHILAHHREDRDFAIFDEKINTNKSEKSQQESFANYFASNLLLPERAVGTTLQVVRRKYNITDSGIGDIEILFLSRIYGVSFEVAAKRCEDLGLLPSGGAISLYETLLSKHVSPEKRAEQLNMPPRNEVTFPKVSANLISEAVKKISQGSISIGKASEILSIPISDIMGFYSNIN